MRTLVVGEAAPDPLPAGLGGQPGTVERWAGPATDGSPAALARALLEAEARLGAERPDRVVVAGDDDGALATVLVAAKLLIELRPLPGAPAPDPARAATRRLISLLSSSEPPPTLATS